MKTLDEAFRPGSFQLDGHALTAIADPTGQA
jgi:hypothetical protein